MMITLSGRDDGPFPAEDRRIARILVAGAAAEKASDMEQLWRRWSTLEREKDRIQIEVADLELAHKVSAYPPTVELMGKRLSTAEEIERFAREHADDFIVELPFLREGRRMAPSEIDAIVDRLKAELAHGREQWETLREAAGIPAIEERLAGLEKEIDALIERILAMPATSPRELCMQLDIGLEYEMQPPCDEFGWSYAVVFLRNLARLAGGFEFTALGAQDIIAGAQGRGIASAGWTEDGGGTASSPCRDRH